jgi:predicted PurR-regulated permease PerM
MVIAITVLSLLLACMTIVFAFVLKVIRRMSNEIKYQEDIIDAKNDSLKYYLDSYQDVFDELMKLRISTANKRSPGRPKGSKNKVTKPKFSQKEFDKKYGK